MNLPRWLSPVRTVEAATGWARWVCRRFVSQSDDEEGFREATTFCALAPAAFLVLYTALAALLNALGAGHALWRSWAFYTVGGALGVLLMGACMKRRHRRILLTLDRFGDQCWCLQCQSPMPEGACAICPECGEPIPPEIARLVAERKADTA